MFQCPLHMFLFMGPLHSLRDTIIHWKKIEFDWYKKVSIFAQSLISHYFRGPYDGCSWWAPARGCPHFSNFWKSPKNEASRAKKLKYFVFWAPQNSQSFRISEQKISFPVPVPYVSLHGPITLLEGHHNPLKKNWIWLTQKS